MTKVFKYFREPLHAKDEERREELQGNVRPNEVSFSEEGMIKYILSDCRGCLTEPASELDLAWSGYVETVERLVVAVDGRMDPLRLNAERAVRQLDTRISDAIMHAMENGPALEEKVSTRRKNSSTRVIFVRRTGWIFSLGYRMHILYSLFFKLAIYLIYTVTILRFDYCSLFLRLRFILLRVTYVGFW